MTFGLALSLVANLILAGVFAAALARSLRHREARKQRGILRPWPIRRVEIDQFDARFATTPLGPARDSEIRFIAGFRVTGGISDFESWILCVLARQARRIFEFGTCTGKTRLPLAPTSSKLLPPASRTAPGCARPARSPRLPLLRHSFRSLDAGRPGRRKLTMVEVPFGNIGKSLADGWHVQEGSGGNVG